MSANSGRSVRRTKQCQGKLGHRTRQGATRAIEKLRQSGWPGADFLSPYRCHCGRWHFGHHHNQMGGSG